MFTCQRKTRRRPSKQAKVYYAGVPQGHFERINNNVSGVLRHYLKESESFVKTLTDGAQPNYGSLTCLDIEKHAFAFEDGPLRHLRIKTTSEEFTSVSDAIHDLSFVAQEPSDYVSMLNNECFGSPPENWQIENTQLRNNSPKVQSRFRIYQILRDLDPIVREKINRAIRAGATASLTEVELSSVTKAGWVLDTAGNRIDQASIEDVRNILGGLHSKKRTQKALIANLPAPAALAIPDDACHHQTRV